MHPRAHLYASAVHRQDDSGFTGLNGCALAVLVVSKRALTDLPQLARRRLIREWEFAINKRRDGKMMVLPLLLHEPGATTP